MSLFHSPANLFHDSMALSFFLSLSKVSSPFVRWIYVYYSGTAELLITRAVKTKRRALTRVNDVTKGGKIFSLPLNFSSRTSSTVFHVFHRANSIKQMPFPASKSARTKEQSQQEQQTFPFPFFFFLSIKFTNKMEFYIRRADCQFVSLNRIIPSTNEVFNREQN